MSQNVDDEANVACALACARTGVVLGSPQLGAECTTRAQLEELAATAIELLETGSATDFATLLAELSQPDRDGDVHELVLISAERVYVVQRSQRHQESTLIAVAGHKRKLGLLLSTLRGRLLQLESAT